MSRVDCIRSISASCVFTSSGLGAMVRGARQNGSGPVNLFEKHDANHLMRPGRRAKCNTQVSPALQIGRKPVRASNCENSIGDPIVPPAAELSRKRHAVNALAALI